MNTSNKLFKSGSIVGKNNNIIEINGIRYDTKSGKPLGEHAHKPAASSLQPTIKRPTMSDVVHRQPAKHTSARSPKPSNTLMRHSVKKPAVAPRKHSRAQGHALAKPVDSVLTKKSANQVDGKRLVKAKRVPQSKLIQHFGPVTSDSNQFRPSALPISLPTAIPAAPQRPTASARPTKTAAQKPQTTAELLDHALRHATTHEHSEPVKRKKRHGLRVGLTAAVLLLLAGAVFVQQIPNIRMHMASAKAGFHASLPGYKPAGYSLSKLDSTSGVVATTFNSNSDQRKYTLTQKTSNWDSQALRDNFVVGHDKNYKTETSAGRTIYIYGNQNATWVNAGIWYIVQSDGSLTDNQLTELAGSL